MNHKWISNGIYEHPAAHQTACGNVILSQAGSYALLVGGGVMSCPQDWAGKIHADEIERSGDEGKNEFCTTRKLLGITQAQAAEICGVRTAEAVAHWESGRRTVPASAIKLMRMAVAAAEK